MKPSRKKSLFIKVMVGLCTLIVGNAYAQVNYVLNPSLEELYQCPDYLEVHNAKHWFTPIYGQSPDLMSTCAMNSVGSNWCGVPVNFMVNIPGYEPGYQYPKTGGNYAHFITYAKDGNASDYREYIKVEMKEKLVANKTYCVKYYLNLTNFSKYGSDEVGAYFSADGLLPNYSWNNLPGAYALSPQVKSPTGVALTDTLNWMTITGTFTAQGNERYIIFGSYKSNTQTHLSIIQSDAPEEKASYYLDDVSVIESDLPAYAGEDVTIGIGDSVFIGRQPEIGLECVWTDLQGNVVGNEAGMWVQPTQPTTYIVTQDLCGNIKHDTVTVYAFPTGIAVENNKNQPFISPIISQGEVYVTVPQAAGNQQLHIMDNQGKVHFSHTFEANATLTPLSLSLAPGVYFAHFQSLTTHETFTQKIVIH